MSTDSVLLIFGLAGIYLYGFYSIIALVAYGLETSTDRLFLVIHLMSVIESTIQSVFIINTLNMFTKDKQIRKKKPARSLITMLILINISIWMLETLSVKKYDMNTVQLSYYDIVFWSIASSISTPLAIFYRFHVSVCLSDIWKTLYEYEES